MGMKVFITGSTGFIGQPLTWAMLHRGWQVTALVRRTDTTPVRLLRQAGAQLVVGDVATSERGLLREAMRGAELVFHNAGWYELGLRAKDRPAMHAVNVEGTDTILGLARQMDIPKIVFTSSTVALGDTAGALVDESFVRSSPPLSYYEQTKTEAHALALDFQRRGAPVVILCPAQVIGPGDHSPFGSFARLYVRGLLPPMVWAPDSVYSMAHVDDVGEAMVLAAERGQPGRTYFLSGSAITMREMIETWKQTPGGLKPFVWLPRPLAVLTGLVSAPLLRAFGQRAFLSREVIEASYVCYRFGSARAESELGAHFRPAAQAWRDTLEAERAARRP
jgi:dihydroflavonol-4-reductase